ncbi:MAG: hypothetical protein IT488_13805 [Gammaproteobacteria bacterium]|nr:hypothetical protein [Gammaproteobacteria bacterium]
MNPVWRFYVDEKHQWRWQHLGIDHAVVAESRKGYAEYDGCMDDARRRGYQFQPSQVSGLRHESLSEQQRRRRLLALSGVPEEWLDWDL